MMKQYGNIYIIKNKINNKMYVGQTINSVRIRIAGHKYSSKMLIGRAIRKYKINNFYIYEYTNIPIIYLDYCEFSLINRLNTLSPNGYNLSLGGNCNKYGLTEDHKNKIGLKHKGKKLSKEHRYKLYLAHIGKPSPFKGKHHTDKAKEKMSKARINCSPWNIGIPMSDETKRKASSKLKGRAATNNRHIICIETQELFKSIREAAYKYNLPESNLCACLKNKLISCGKKHWKYTGDL